MFSFNVFRRLKLTTPSIQCVQFQAIQFHFNWMCITNSLPAKCFTQTVIAIWIEPNERKKFALSHTEIRSKKWLKNRIEKLWNGKNNKINKLDTVFSLKWNDSCTIWNVMSDYWAKKKSKLFKWPSRPPSFRSFITIFLFFSICK